MRIENATLTWERKFPRQWERRTKRIGRRVFTGQHAWTEEMHLPKIQSSNSIIVKMCFSFFNRGIVPILICFRYVVKLKQNIKLIYFYICLSQGVETIPQKQQIFFISRKFFLYLGNTYLWNYEIYEKMNSNVCSHFLKTSKIGMCEYLKIRVGSSRMFRYPNFGIKFLIQNPKLFGTRYSIRNKIFLTDLKGRC